MKRKTRLMILAGTAAAAVLILFLFPRIPQPPEYHDFADQRAFLGIPHFLDTVSNAAFLAVGGLALAALFSRSRRGNRPVFIEDREKWPWVTIFTGALLTGFGSAFYHWDPHNASLVWDRLPMTLVAMGFLAAMLTERVDVNLGLRLLPVLVVIGAASVFWWIFTESRDVGDLRFYGLVQFLPILLTPLILLFFAPRYDRTGDIFGALGFYILAKIFEALDQWIFALGQLVSGHTLKHFAAALAIYWLFRMIDRRKILPSATPVAHARRRPRQAI